MNSNQYCGPAANYLPVPNATPYYQHPIMSPRINEPASLQANQVSFSQPVMNRPNSMPQYSPNQYGNNQNVDYSVASPVVQNSTPFQPIPQNIIHNQANTIQSPRPPNYQCRQPSQMSIYPSQTIPNYNNYPNSYQYGDTVNVQGICNTAQPLQNPYSSNTNNPGHVYPPQGDPQQLTYPQGSNIANMAATSSREPSTITNKEHVHFKETTQEDVQKFKPTNVIGEYKCSDFPNLYTGPFRYSGYPVQRKPFTLKNDSARHESQSYSGRRTHIGLARHAKRWELRGGKYYGCFTSRTNGLQDVCPKAKCKLCPTDRKK